MPKRQEKKIKDISKFLKSTSLLFHLVGTCMFCFAVYYDYFHVNFPLKEHDFLNSFGGKFKFMTFLNGNMLSIYFTISLLNDLFGSTEVASKENLPFIRNLRDYMFAGLAFPSGFTVGTFYWVMSTVDENLVLPHNFFDYFPRWLDHILHTNVTIFVILELFLTFRQYPKRRTGLTIYFIFNSAYLIWIHIVRYVTGIWVYSFVNNMPFLLRLIFFLTSYLPASLNYLIGERINNYVWRDELKELTEKPKKNEKLN